MPSSFVPIRDDDSKPQQRALSIVQPRSLPYIAQHGDSVHNACTKSGLHLYEPKGWVNKPLFRRVYASNRFIEWASSGIQSVTISDLTQSTARGQLKAELDGFCNGDALMVAKDFHCLEPYPDFVWQLKTPDLRLFGWFIMKNCMVLDQGGDANILHQGWSKYEPYIKSVKAFRVLLSDLPEPLKGVRASDVVSNRVR